MTRMVPIKRTRTKTATPGVRKVTTKTGDRTVISYEARVESNGREITKSFGALADARTFRSEALHHRNTGTLTDTRLAKITFATWVNGGQWQRHLETLRPKTQSLYKRSTNTAVKEFGTMPLQRITSDTITEFQRTLAKTRNPGGTRLELRVVRTCLAHAVKAGFIPKNPASGFVVIEDIAPQDRSERRSLSEDEAARLMAQIPDQWRALVATSLTLGLRFSELAGLQRKHVDLEANQIRVERQAYWHDGVVHETPPKTKAGVRVLPIPADLAPLLAKHLDQYSQTGGDGLVFPSPRSGQVINGSNFRARVWIPAIKRANIRHVVFHGLRITSTTWLLDAGVNAKVVSTMQGHSSPAVTLNVYARASEASQRDAAERVGSILGRALQLPANVVPITSKTKARKGVDRGTAGADTPNEAISGL
jgi:integrase